MKTQACKSKCTNLLLCLPNDLLLEIFYRLPTFESIVRCKSVCKHWLNLITTPGFDAQYIAFRITVHLSKNSKLRDDDELHPHVFCIRRFSTQPFIHPNHSSFTCLDSLLSFIPCYQGRVGSVAIRSWCNDLVLCTSWCEDHGAFPKELELYICNPRTRQYIQLPPPSDPNQRCIAGFMCDPYYVFDKQTGQVTLNNNFRYCVCYAVPRIAESTTLRVEIFSSETRVWKKAELRTPHIFRFMHLDFKSSFTYKGMLHWYSDGSIVGFDPYKIDADGVIRCHFIDMPPFNLLAKDYRSVDVRVFGEQLLLVEFRSRLALQAQGLNQLSIEQNNTAYAVTAWELKSYDSGEWSMKHVIYLHEFVSADAILIERIKRGCPYTALLYIYPNDADMLLLLHHRQIVECDMKRKTMKTVCRFAEFGVPKVYSVAFQWWPSQLPLNI